MMETSSLVNVPPSCSSTTIMTNTAPAASTVIRAHRPAIATSSLPNPGGDHASAITAEQLSQLLSSSTDDLCILDCRARGPSIRLASRVRLPGVLARRLSAGRLEAWKLSPRLADGGVKRVVLIPEDDHSHLSTMIARLLQPAGYDVAVFQDDVAVALSGFPYLAEPHGSSSTSSSDAQHHHHDCSTATAAFVAQNSFTANCSPPPEPSALNLRSLTLDTSSCAHRGDWSRVEGEGEARERQRARFPVELLPHLYLGNAETARDLTLMKTHGITHVINVTASLDCPFPEQINYLRVPVDDSASHDLKAFFPTTNAFIADALSDGRGACMVHCVAGISRSVSVCLAYVMWAHSVSLEAAYDLLLGRNAAIAPNFHFMGQLQEYERQLVSSPPSSSSAHAPPPRALASPRGMMAAVSGTAPTGGALSVGAAGSVALSLLPTPPSSSASTHPSSAGSEVQSAGTACWMMPSAPPAAV